MDRVGELTSLIASYWHVPPDSLNWDTELSPIGLRQFTSLRWMRFLASVEERFGITVADPDTIRSFRDLRRLVAP
jgi:hypothetical protein